MRFGYKIERRPNQDGNVFLGIYSQEVEISAIGTYLKPKIFEALIEALKEAVEKKCKVVVSGAGSYTSSMSTITFDGTDEVLKISIGGFTATAEFRDLLKVFEALARKKAPKPVNQKNKAYDFFGF